MTDRRRALPSVDHLLQQPGVRALCDLAPRNVVAGAVRDAIARARTRRAGMPDDWTAEVADLVRQRLRLAADLGDQQVPLRNLEALAIGQQVLHDRAQGR